MLSIGSTVLGVNDVGRAVQFWTSALGYVLRPGHDETWAVVIPPDGRGAQLALALSETPVQEYPRIHLDLYAGDAADQQAEVKRLIGLGAQPVEWDRYDENADYIVLADPDGNRFCVINTDRAH